MPHFRAGACASLLLCAAALAGCAQRAPTVQAPPVIKALENRGADGTYRGTSTRFQADRRTCPSPGLVTLRVLDGVFSYRWNRDASVLATIAPDGTVSGAGGDISLTGRADGRKIEGDVTNGSCAYHFTASRKA